MDALACGFAQKASAWIFSKGSAIEGNQGKCSQYNDPPFHVSLPSPWQSHISQLIGKGLAVKRGVGRPRLGTQVNRAVWVNFVLTREL